MRLSGVVLASREVQVCILAMELFYWVATLYKLFTHIASSVFSASNKKAQLSLTNPHDAKACQKLLQFDVLTTLSLTILAYLH